MGTKLVNKVTGQAELVDDADLSSALASGKYVAPDAIAARSAGAEDTYVAPDQFQLEQGQGLAQAVDPATLALEQGHAARAKAHSGVVATGKAIAGGAIGTATFGVVDPFREDQEFNRGAAIVGSVAGAVVPGLLGDEAGLAELVNDPVATERAASGLSSKFLYGDAAGAKGAGRAAEEGIAGARTDIEAGQAAAAAPEDLAGLDAKGLRSARDAELDRLAGEQGTTRAAAKSQAVDDVLAYRAAVKQANPWLVIDEGENASRLNKANRTLRGALDDAKGLRESPGSLLKPLRIEEKALEGAVADREAIVAKLDKVNAKIASNLEEDLATLPDSATHVELSGKAARRYAAYADVKVGKNAVVQVAREDASQFLEALQKGDVQGTSAEALQKLPGLLDQNRALQAQIKAATAPMVARGELTSAKLAAIADAQDALIAGRGATKPSLVEEMLGGSIMGHVSGALSGMPIIGHMLGAKAGQLAKKAIFGGLGKVSAEAGERTAKAVRALLDVGKKALPAAPVVASRVLASVRYAPTVGAGARTPHEGLAGVFHARAAELRSQTAYGPDGAPQMTQAARAAMAARLAPIRAVSPVLGDRLETIAARRVEFLSSKLPRRPDFGMTIGPDHWQPSDMEMRTFARYVAAVEDPSGVEDRLANGTITPEDAEAYRAVYPERLEDLKRQVIAQLPTLQRSLPYERRLALSIFTDIAVDPAMDPQVLAILQGQFAAEEGSAGGTQAPRAQPQFGSVTKPKSTPAQERSQGDIG